MGKGLAAEHDITMPLSVLIVLDSTLVIMVPLTNSMLSALPNIEAMLRVLINPGKLVLSGHRDGICRIS